MRTLGGRSNGDSVCWEAAAIDGDGGAPTRATVPIRGVGGGGGGLIGRPGIWPAPIAPPPLRSNLPMCSSWG